MPTNEFTQQDSREGTCPHPGRSGSGGSSGHDFDSQFTYPHAQALAWEQVCLSQGRHFEATCFEVALFLPTSCRRFQSCGYFFDFLDSDSCTAIISKSPNFCRGQKNPRNPSPFLRGTIW